MSIVETQPEGNAEAVSAPIDDVPEKYRGKTEAELRAMHQELERKLGEQSEEIGSLRSLAEQQIMQPASSNESYEDIDFYADPERAVERLLDQKLKPYTNVLQQQTQEQVKTKLSSEFPDWQNTVSDEAFQQWVGKSKVRTELFRRADSADYDAASELFSTWADINQSKQSTTQAATKAVDRDRKLRAATTEKGSAGIDPRKILNRADLRNLKQTNPSRYNDLLPDIRKAYAEGRVR